MSRSRKADVVLDSARRLFLERGFSGTTVDDIAAAAGVSKATVYSNFRDKESLLLTLVEQVSSEAADVLAETFGPLDGEGTVEARLVAVATALVEGVLRPQVVQLRRLAIAEAARLPRAGTSYWERAPEATLERLARAFQHLQQTDGLAVGDARMAAEQFAYALLGPLQDRALLAPDRLPSEQERAEHVRAVVARFLPPADG